MKQIISYFSYPTLKSRVNYKRASASAGSKFWQHRLLSELPEAPVNLCPSLTVLFIWAFSFYSEIKNMPGQSGFIPNMCYNCFLGDEMNATLCNEMNLLSYGCTLENVNGQHRPPGMLTPGKQFRKATKSQHNRIMAHLKVHLEVILCTIRHSLCEFITPQKIYINGDTLISL